MQNTQPFRSVQLHALGTQGRKVGNEVGPHAGKVGAGLFHVFLHHGDGDIFLLSDSIGPGGLIQQHLIVFPAVLVPKVLLHRHEDGVFKVCLIRSPVIDGDFRHRPGIQRVEKLRIDEKHTLFVLAACHQIIDVAEPIAFGKLVSSRKNAVLPDTADGDHILHFPGHGISLLVLLGHDF